MASISGLSVRVSASTQAFRRRINAAQDAAQDLSLSLRRLGVASNSAERDIESTGRSATTVAAQMGALSVASSSTSTAFMGLSVVTVASLIPALITLSSVLFPIVGALGGFIALAGGAAFLGFAGALAAIAVNTERLREGFNSLVETFLDVFGPAIEKATHVLDIFMSDLEAVAPQLEPSASELEHLGGIFSELSRAITGLLPMFMDLAITLTRDFLPGFIDFIKNVGPQIPGMIQGMVDTFEELLPTLRDVGVFLMEFIPAFTEFGFSVLNVIGPSIARLGEIFLTVTRRINNMDSGMRNLTIGLMTVLPVITGLATTLGPIIAQFVSLQGIISAVGTAITVLSGPIGVVIALIAVLATAWATNFGNIRGSVNNAVSSISEDLERLKPVFRGFIEFFNTFVKPALVAVADALGTLFEPVVNALEKSFGLVVSTITGALSGLFDFIVDIAVAMSRLFAGDTDGALAIIVQAFKDAFVGLIEFFGMWQRTVTDIIVGGVVDMARAIVQTANEVPGVNLGNPEEMFTDVESGLQTIQDASRQRQQQATQAVQNVEVTIEGDTDVVRDVAVTATDQRMNDQQDRVEMNTGTSSAPR